MDALDVSVALRGGVTGRSRAWDFVRRFAAEWTGRPLGTEDGYGAAELDAEEAELGFALPAALREGYALFGRRNDLTRHQDPLVTPAGLDVDDGILLFRRENQDCAAWGIPLDQIEQDDPPVLVKSCDGWIPFLDKMSVAWVEMVLSESLFSPGKPYDACELPDTLLPNLHGRYTRVDLPDHPMWASAEDSPVRWYAAPGRLLRRDGLLDLCWLHAGGRTTAELEMIRSGVGGRWVN